MLRLAMSALALLTAVSLSAQNIQIKGVVKDSDGLPLPGAAVYIPGTSVGVTTDLDGLFTIQAAPGTGLVISSIGFDQQTVKVSREQDFIEVVLKSSAMLDEVVVTALGVAREKKTLGYAIQDVKGDALLDAHETNIANALTGKIAGVNIVRSSNGPGASSKIILRGNSSLTGLNQPLIVVDGIPMDNFIGASNNDFWNPSADMGNGLQDINPEDVESMTVLKGASAAALYGSRAGNGVILITTKKGRETPGLGITVSGTVQTFSEFTRPAMQSRYGQGSLGTYDATSTLSWGPEIVGQSVTKWDGASAPLEAFDNVKGFFGTGISDTENITFSQQYGKTGIYASYTRTSDTGMVSTQTLDRNNFMLRGTSTFGKDDRWHFDAKVQFVRTEAHNRPISGSNLNANYMLKMYTTPVSVDIRDFSAATDSSGDMFYYGTADKTGSNPYWMAKYSCNTDVRDRFLMYASLKYDFTDWLDLEARVGSDMYTTETESRTYAGNKTSGSYTGSFGLGESRFFENNFSFLLKAHKDHIFGDWGAAASFGGNLMERETRGMSSNNSQLQVPNVFSLNNSVSKTGVSESYSHRKMNSLYGTAQLNYGGFVFLDATFRNDWTSTLSRANRSFFYPSLSLSYVISDMVGKYWTMPDWITYAKVRGSFAEVGNDMDPYQLYNIYTLGTDPNGNSVVNTSGTLYDENVKNELIKSWEAGIDVRFLDGRIGIDLSWYKTNATNQLINLPVNAIGGYSSKKINAGDIQNQGVELMLTAVPVRKGAFVWNSNINFAANSNKILALADGVESYQLGGYDKLQIVANVGGKYGDIYGTKYTRVEDEKSEHFGKLVLNSSGLPTSDGSKYLLGNQNPVCTLGWTNSFQWRDLSFGFQIDARIGGKMFSGTLMAMEYAGTAAWTADRTDDLVVDGVVKNDDGTYSVNTTKTTTEKYWQQISGAAGSNLGITEENLYDATNVRLRNLSVSYTLPRKICQGTGFLQTLKVGVSCNNVAMLYSRMRGLDPESIFATSTNATGFEYGASPTMRSYIFNITLGF